MKFYLAGKVPKGNELDTYIDFRVGYGETLAKSFPDLTILDPNGTTEQALLVGVTEEDPLYWFGHDCWMIKKSDVVIVQADIKLGAGTAQEMLIAKYFNKPVITVLPKDTHHRRTNLMLASGVVEDWIHPFVGSTSDLIVEKLEDSLPWLEAYNVNPDGQKIKTIEVIDEAITYFEEFIAAANVAIPAQRRL
ncbi:MAG: hypothetical protein OXR68_02165 [Alphaproteobacteria bacterium]|nr:hypothetical protein [Alphaproteobacteria bacterium]MDD9919416.1 hypothetical protein [Alphaproteobacteria bacterium]